MWWATVRRVYPLLIASLLMAAFGNVLNLNAASYDCYSVYDDDYGSYSWVWAWAYGCVTTPSDGNIYNPKHAGGGDVFNVDGFVIHLYDYIEQGCDGDVFVSYTYSFVDPDGDGTFTMVAKAIASIYAGPCGSF